MTHDEWMAVLVFALLVWAITLEVRLYFTTDRIAAALALLNERKHGAKITEADMERIDEERFT